METDAIPGNRACRCRIVACLEAPPVRLVTRRPFSTSMTQRTLLIAILVLVAGLLRIFGARIKLVIEKYFDVLALLFLLLLVGGFVALKYLH